MKYLFYALLLYLAYVFVFRLVIPVVLTTRKIKKGFREMQARMQAEMERQQQATARPSQPEAKKEKAGDYIEFEEIR